MDTHLRRKDQVTQEEKNRIISLYVNDHKTPKQIIKIVNRSDNVVYQTLRSYRETSPEYNLPNKEEELAKRRAASLLKAQTKLFDDSNSFVRAPTLAQLMGRK